MSSPDRRSFTRALTGGMVSALSAPRVRGANDRIRVGIIGCGGMGRSDWNNFLHQSDVTPVAVCDVYEPFRERAVQMSRENVAAFKDCRRLLDRTDIDAVIVAPPDHWHALLTVMACRAGKDVYVEKPLSLTVREGRVMVDTARRHNLLVQVGTHERSGEQF